MNSQHQPSYLNICMQKKKKLRQKKKKRRQENERTYTHANYGIDVHHQPYDKVDDVNLHHISRWRCETIQQICNESLTFCQTAISHRIDLVFCSSFLGVCLLTMSISIHLRSFASPILNGNSRALMLKCLCFVTCVLHFSGNALKTHFLLSHHPHECFSGICQCKYTFNPRNMFSGMHTSSFSHSVSIRSA